MSLFCLQTYIRSLHGWNFLFLCISLGFLATNVAIVVEYSTDSDILGIFLKDCIYLFWNNIVAIACPILIHMYMCMFITSAYMPRHFSHLWLFVMLWTHQAPLSMGFSRQEYWSGFIFIILAKNSIIYAYYVIFKSFESMILKIHPSNMIFIFNLWEKLFQFLNT